MPIPPQKEISKSIMDMMRDGHERRVKDITEALAQQFALTPEDRAEKYPKGVRKLPNMVHVACKNLTKIGHLCNPSHGNYKIDSDAQLLQPQLEPSELPDPRDSIEGNIKSLHEQLANELLEHISKCSPAFFEQLVVELILALGYGRLGTGYVTGGSGDGGIDGIIEEDKLGLDKICLQAKRYKPENKVSVGEIDRFIGSKPYRTIGKGIFITTSEFTPKAKGSACTSHIVLIDGPMLAQLMIDYDVGVSTESTWILKRIDSEYFDT